MTFFDYLYYRIYKAYSKKDSTPEVFGSAIVSLTQFFILLTIFDTVERFIELFNIPNKYYVIPVIICIMVFNWYRYERRNKFPELDERWGNEEPRKRKVRGYLVVIAIIGLFLIPITLGILRHNLGINI